MKCPTCGTIILVDSCLGSGGIPVTEELDKKEAFLTGLVGIAQILKQIKAKEACLGIPQMMIGAGHVHLQWCGE